LWKFIADGGGVCQHLFEFEILTKLNGSEIKFLYGTNTESRLAIKRAKMKLDEKFWIRELSSISQLELAWAYYDYDWDEYGWDVTQELFCEKVAHMNKLEYLVWLREVKNCDWDWRTIRFAARQGNIAMVKYCVDNGCPMDEWACTFAAEKGHLDVLKYLHENDCPWDSWACTSAHANNRIDCLNYLIQQRCEGFEEYIQ
jgi:hypothetical protein